MIEQTMKTHLIIGTSAAALGVVQKLRSLDPESTIICVSDEAEFPYNKCFLADYLSGLKTEAQTCTKPPSFFEDNRIQLILGTRVTAIDARHKKVLLQDGQSLAYDSLFLGTGSSPVVPAVFARALDEKTPGLFLFHTLADANAILAYAAKKNVQRAVVVGAGLSGLECADALAQRGVAVTVASRQGRVLRRFVDERASEFIEALMKKKGVLLCKDEPTSLRLANNAVVGVVMQSGNIMDAEMVIVATGLKPNSELAVQAGLATRDDFVIVDDAMRTSDPSVWAGGDCCVVRDLFAGNLVPSTTWPDAMLQGMIAAHGMSGREKKYPGMGAVVSSSFFGTQFVAAGLTEPQSPGQLTRITAGDDFYHKLIFEGERLKGFLLVGQTGRAVGLKRALLTGEAFESR